MNDRRILDCFGVFAEEGGRQIDRSFDENYFCSECSNVLMKNREETNALCFPTKNKKGKGKSKL